MSKLVKNVRIERFDYKTDGFYFITNNTYFSKALIKDAIKEVAKEVLLELAKKFIGAKIVYYSIMPTHIHVIVQLENCNTTIPEIWRVFKSKTTVLARKRGLQTRHLWQPNYFEHVIRNEQALEKIVEYIHNNPFKESLPLEEIYGDRIPEITIV